MKRITAIAFLLACESFGQSSLFNLSYRPQPRVLIPLVERTVGTNIVRYSDFRLVAIDNSSQESPVVWEYSSLLDSPDVLLQPKASVFFQDTSLEAPGTYLRRKYYPWDVVRFTAFTNWSLIAITTNNCPDEIVYTGGRLATGTVFQRVTSPMPVNNGGWNGYIHEGMNSGGTVTNPIYFYQGTTKHYYYVYQNLWTHWALFEIDNGTASGGAWDVSTNFINSFFSCSQVKLNTAARLYPGGSIASASSNSACAIEVYPDMEFYRQTLKQRNADLKWMCTLSHGEEVYSTEAGLPVWFNCWVEWVDRAPSNGIY